MRHSGLAVFIACGVGLPTASAQSVTLHFDADTDTAYAGQVVRWTVSASYTGYDDPTAYFGSYIGSFVSGARSLGLAHNGNGLLSSDTGTNQPIGADMTNVRVSNLALLGTDDPANPIPIFEFDVVAHASPGDGPLTYTANGEADVYPNNGIFTPPDEFATVASVSDSVEISQPAFSTLMEISPDVGSAGYDEPVTWTATINVNSDRPIDVETISGRLTAERASFDPTALTPLQGGTLEINRANNVTWNFSYIPDAGTVIGEGITPLFTFDTELRVPGRQRFNGDFSTEIIYGGVALDGNSGFIGAGGSVDGPAQPSVIIRHTPETDAVTLGETVTWTTSVELTELGGQDLTIDSITAEGHLVGNETVVGTITPLIGSIVSTDVEPHGAFRFELDPGGAPIPPGAPVEIATFETTSAVAGNTAYEGRGSADLHLNGIAINPIRPYSDAAELFVDPPFGFDIRLEPRVSTIEQGEEIVYDVVIELAPDAPRVRSAVIDRFSQYSPSHLRLGATTFESDLRNPSPSLFENFDEMGDPIVTDDTFTLATGTNRGILPGSGTLTADIDLVFFEESGTGDPGIEMSLDSYPLPAGSYTVNPRSTPWFAPEQMSGFTADVLSAALIDPATLAVGFESVLPGESAITILDITDPGTRNKIGSISPPNPSDHSFLSGVRTSGSTLLAGDTQGNYLYDLSDPTTPELVATLPAGDARIDGDLLVIRSGDQFTPYDITDPASPVALTPYTAEAAPGVGAERWAITDSYLVVSSVVEGLIDPVCCSSHDCGNCDTFHELLGGVYDTATGMRLADLESERIPTFEFGDYQSAGIAVEGDAAYIGYLGDQGAGLYDDSQIRVYDLSVAGEAPVVATLRTTFPWEVGLESTFGSSITAEGELLVVGSTRQGDIEFYQSYTGGWFHLFDITDPAAPVLVTEFPGAPWLSALPGGARDDNGFGEVFSISGGTIVMADTLRGRVATERVPNLAGCSPADLAAPYGVTDLADVTAFVDAFSSGDPLVDANGDGLFDLADIVAFVAAFNGGCP